MRYKKLSKVRLTTLNAGEYFETSGKKYEKLENREHGRRCRNVDTDEVVAFPLMLYVEKIEKPIKKRAKKTEKVVEKIEETKTVVDETTQILTNEDFDEQEPLSPSF